ncbi:MAG: hypothetical protein J6U22_00200 [Bacteroidaceae bacterium]|nr:hypothetical protein [Bacteroidaceae bacterium]
MTEEMQMRYVRKVMAEWDREGQLATAIMTGEARGEAKGLAEERFDIAKKMLKIGFFVNHNLIT